MMRSLWTAASGMKGQQLNVDTISNNISNVNTTGFKKERLEFKSLLYQTIDRASLDEQDMGKPVNLQVGLGVNPIATSRMFSVGSLQKTENKLDFAIEGDGFFLIRKPGEEQPYFTKDGTFKISPSNQGNLLVTSEGYNVLNSEGEPIILDASIPLNSINVNKQGVINYNRNGVDENSGMTIGIVQFPNPQGLEAVGGNLFKANSSSGEAIFEDNGDLAKKSYITQGFLELSNVNIAEEMVNLIVAQRAYELNSKAITTSDEMLQQANNLKR